MYFRYQDAAAPSLEGLVCNKLDMTFYHDKHLAKPIPDPLKAGKAGGVLSPTDWVKFVVKVQGLYKQSFTLGSVNSALIASNTVRGGTIIDRICSGKYRPVKETPPDYEDETDNYHSLVKLVESDLAKVSRSEAVSRMCPWPLDGQFYKQSPSNNIMGFPLVPPPETKPAQIMATDIQKRLAEINKIKRVS